MKTAQAGVKHDGRAAFADAGDVQPVATDIDQLASSGVAVGIAGRHERLVARAEGQEEDDHCDHSQQHTSGPAPDSMGPFGNPGSRRVAR